MDGMWMKRQTFVMALGKHLNVGNHGPTDGENMTDHPVSGIHRQKDSGGSDCGSQSSDVTALQICYTCIRHVWKLKLLIAIICAILYAFFYIGAVTVQSRYTLPRGRTLMEDLYPDAVMAMHNMTPVRPVKNDMQIELFRNVENFLVRFKREVLRLHFKELTPLASKDRTYDNANKYQCTMPKVRSLRKTETEDLFCMDRPAYFEALKNPCFRPRPYQSPGIFCLPYFHVLGADKCGTTDFHARLMEHPQILPNAGVLGKELYFWGWLRLGVFMKQDMNEVIPFRWYLSQFHAATSKIQKEFFITGRQLITGDGTPIDFWDFRGWKHEPLNKGKTEPEVLTPHVMRHMYRDPRFFLLMRNPVDRLYSDYVFLGYGFSASQFAQDVPVAIEMMTKCLEVNSSRQCFFSDHLYRTMPMRLHVSCYSMFLREWLSVFQREHFFFLRTEDYHANTKGTLQAAFKFLDVEPLSETMLEAVSSRAIKHKTMLKEKAGPIFPETRKLLEEFYSRCNEDLAELLGDERFLWKDSKTRINS